MIEYLLIKKYFGFHAEKGGYWYSFRNLFLVIFSLEVIGTLANLFDKEISYEGIIGLIISAAIATSFNFMAKRYVLKYLNKAK